MTQPTLPRSANPFAVRAFWIAILINAVWINVSEIWRYFALVMPMTREDLAMVPGVAPMDWIIFLRWGVWDTIWLFACTGFVWLWLERFGSSLRNAVLAATLIWAAVFVILWFGLLNLNLATPRIALTALPLAWAEAVVAALIARWQFNRSPLAIQA